MGVKVLVLHPRNFFIDDDMHKPYDFIRSKKENLCYISGYLKEIEKVPGLRLAVENLRTQALKLAYDITEYLYSFR